MEPKDPFDFAAAARADVDLSLFAPKAKPTDVGTAEAASEVAQSAGFSRRTSTGKSEPKIAEPLPVPKGSKRRVNITEMLGVEDRYPDSERAQVNMLVPVPIVVRWRQLCKAEGGPVWAVFERAVEALEAQAKVPDGQG